MFRIDGLGALVSAGLLGVVLPAFQPYIGLPRPVLYLLAGLALVLATYSGICAYRSPLRRRLWLGLIMAANLAYCALTVGLMVAFAAALEPLGFVYFAGEVAVILALVSFEWRVFRR